MTEERSGRRTFFHCRGANAELGLEHFDFSATRARFFHLGYLLLLDRLDAEEPDGAGKSSTAAARVLQLAQANGLKTSIDLVSESGFRFASVVRPALRHIDYIFLNELELSQLTGITVVDNDIVERRAIERATGELFQFGFGGWMFVHFPAAVFACSARGERFWQPALNLPKSSIRGTAGAGDAFASGIIYGLHQQWPMERCLELGVCAAAASLEHPTCSEGVRPIDGYLALAERFGFLTVQENIEKTSEGRRS